MQILILHSNLLDMRVPNHTISFPHIPLYSTSNSLVCRTIKIYYNFDRSQKRFSFIKLNYIKYTENTRWTQLTVYLDTESTRWTRPPVYLDTVIGAAGFGPGDRKMLLLLIILYL